MKTYLCLLLVAAIGLVPGVADELDLKTVQAQAAQGNALAEYELGKAYHLGHGLPQDFVKAAELYRKAAAQGNAKAMYNLGYIFLHGQGVTLDNLAAFQWFQKSADLGLAAAELQIGLDYCFGDEGIKKDYAAAAKWLTLAAKQENVPAECAPAANALGAMNEQGMGMPMDGKKAVYWYTKAAEMGNARAQSNLGRIYVESISTPRDFVQGYMWLKVSSDGGDITAIKLMADYSTAKQFSAAQVAEGGRKAKEFEEKMRIAKRRAMMAGAAASSDLSPSPGAVPATNSTNASPPSGPSSSEH
jgi:TPR repeat protein